MISLIQHFEADFPQKVSLKILNSGIILKTFTHGDLYECQLIPIFRPHKVTMHAFLKDDFMHFQKLPNCHELVHFLFTKYLPIFNSPRPPDKSACLKIIFLISQPKNKLWVLKRTVSMRRFF